MAQRIGDSYWKTFPFAFYTTLTHRLLASTGIWRFHMSRFCFDRAIKMSAGALTRLLASKKPFSTSLTANGTGVCRTALGILGATNSGKSSLMNLLAQSQVSIVNEKEGTTSDPTVCAMELHGKIGPVRLLDTPGLYKCITPMKNLSLCHQLKLVFSSFLRNQREGRTWCDQTRKGISNHRDV